MYTREKGKSLLETPNDYTIIDLETTGLYPSYDDIIEMSAIKCRDDIIVDTFSSLVKIENPDIIKGFIESLTGITPEMLRSAPSIEYVLPKFIEFIGSDIVMAHNANFDINFLYDNCRIVLNMKFQNNFVDTLRLARRACPELKSHKLSLLAEHFEISTPHAHRALYDCETTLSCYKIFKSILPKNFAIKKKRNIKDRNNAENMFYKKTPVDLRTITADLNFIADPDNPFFQKVCVFTGKLEKMTRVSAAKIVVNLGGIADNYVTAKTNILILGNNDYCKTIKDGKSSKQKKAESLILKGHDLHIIPEEVFYQMISEYMELCKD